MVKFVKINVDGEQLITLVSVIREYYSSLVSENEIVRSMMGKGLAKKIVDTLGKYNEEHLIVEEYENGTICSEVKKTEKINIELTETEAKTLLIAIDDFTVNEIVSPWIIDHLKKIQVQIDEQLNASAELTEQDLCNMVSTLYDYFNVVKSKQPDYDCKNLIESAKAIRTISIRKGLYHSWIHELDSIIKNFRQIEILSNGQVIKKITSRKTDVELENDCKIRTENTGCNTTFRLASV
jgi:hypothetical protein